MTEQTAGGAKPPAPATELREQVAEALMAWAERNNAPQYAAMRRPDTVRQNAYSRADAVLAVPAIQQLQARVERVARLADEYPAGIDTALVLEALDGQGQPPVNPPGSTSEQLPANVLALLPIRPYLSTACETAEACETGAAVHRDERPWLHAHAEDLHQRCRLNHKFTGQPCSCRCHDQPARRDR